MELPPNICIKTENCDFENNNDSLLKIQFDVKVKIEQDTIVEYESVESNFPAFANYQESIHYTELIEDSIHACYICDEVFYNKYDLIQHNTSHLKVMLTKPKTHQCRSCLVYFEKFEHLKKHLHNHDKETKPKLQCILCGKYIRAVNLNEHFKTVHSDTNVKCPKCDAVFKCKSYLRKHDLYVHGNLKPSWRFHQVKETNDYIKCGICPSLFSNRSSLTTHIRNCHSGAVYHCDKCCSKFKSLPYLRTHMNRVHYNDGKVYKCECGKTFKSPRYLKVHKKNSNHYFD